MFANSTAWTLHHFGLVMLIAAIIFSMVQWVIHQKVSTYEIIFSWMALLPLGAVGIYTFILHAFFPETAANSIGWQVSPFQFEVAMSDLSMGVLGILSFSASYGFRNATVIGATCVLWGDALGHIHQMLKFHNFLSGNAGSWFWLDILVPLILIICLLKIKPRVYA